MEFANCQVNTSDGSIPVIHKAGNALFLFRSGRSASKGIFYQKIFDHTLFCLLYTQGLRSKFMSTGTTKNLPGIPGQRKRWPEVKKTKDE